MKICSSEWMDAFRVRGAGHGARGVGCGELRKIKFEGQVVQAAQGVIERLLVCVTRCRPIMNTYIGPETVRYCVEATRAFTELSSSVLHELPALNYTTEMIRDFRKRGARMVIDLLQDHFVERVVMHQDPLVGATMLTAVVCLLEQEGVARDEAVGRVLDSILLMLGQTDYLPEYLLNYLEAEQTYNDEVTVYNTLHGALLGDLEDASPTPRC
ncbi:hypothetical protein E2C01_004959 [Portunus trituberculatus]|uniref:Uncharacterized protein n=1 Tax=Portunus trituberculatus TaxID=210409 RepID=A0A5B7CR34_PORTR|nr:hypothetical protein [Portunus trituberculatus]